MELYNFPLDFSFELLTPTAVVAFLIHVNLRASFLFSGSFFGEQQKKRWKQLESLPKICPDTNESYGTTFTADLALCTWRT